MEFGLTEEQRELQKWAHDFAEKEIRPVAPHYDETEEFPWDVLKKAAEVGLYSIDVYVQAAQDPSGLTLPLITEELFWGCAGIALALTGTGLPLMSLWNTGTPEQLAAWAPRMVGPPEAPQVAAFAVTEPQSGSDVSSLRTRARREGDEWVLNGRKVFITNGGVADVNIIVATVDPELGHRGQASFIVTRDAPGFSQGKKERKLGIRASHTSELLLGDVRIPADQILGGVEKFEAKLERARSGQSSGRASAALRTFEVTRPIVGIAAVGLPPAARAFAGPGAKPRARIRERAIQHEPGRNILA